MKCKVLCFFALIFVFSSLSFAQDNEIIVPVIKSPYKISSPKWDKKGESFSYTTNGNVYVRDFLSMDLQNVYSENDSQITNPFFATNSSLTYPNIEYSIDKNKVTIYSQKSALSKIESKEINLPAYVKNIAVNKNQDKIACLGIDDKAFVYDIKKNETVFEIPFNPSSNEVFFTKDNKILLSDSKKTVSMYSEQGQKLKTFTSSNRMNGFSLSPDNENLVIFDEKGILNFYNVKNGQQYGYSPKFNSSNIQEVTLSNNAKRILVRSQNSLYAATVPEILYAQNNIAPPLKDFAVSYNAKNTANLNSNVTEFKDNNITQFISENDTEYITSTKDKKNDKQLFSLDEKPVQDKAVAITPKTKDKLYPASEDETSRTEYLTKKNNVKEINSTTPKIIESNANFGDSTNLNAQNNLSGQNLNGQNISSGTTGISNNTANRNATSNANGGAIGDGNGGTNSNAGIIIVGAGNANNSDSGNNSGNSGGTGNANETNVKSTSIGDSNTKKSTKKEETITNKKTAKEKEDTNKKNDSEKRKKDAEDNDNSLLEKWNKIKEFKDENIKSLFKDGHGILANIGVCMTQEPFPVTFIMPAGYRNYDLLRPVYFGGTLELDFALPNVNFPYSYKNSEGNAIRNPFLIGFKIYAPIGFCMYPLKNSFEIFGEFGLGMGFSGLWSGGFGNHLLITKLYPSFFVNFRTGVAWDFINLTFNFSYDAVTGMSYGIELGAIINIGGSRTIGSMVVRENKITVQ